MKKDTVSDALAREERIKAALNWLSVNVKNNNSCIPADVREGLRYILEVIYDDEKDTT